MNRQDEIMCKRYAEAFFNTVEEQCFKDFKAFVDIYFSHKDFREILIHPLIHVEKKLEFIHKVFDNSSSKLVVDFICLLIKRNAIAFLQTIAYQVNSFYWQKHNIKGIVVKTSVPLMSSEREKLINVLKDKYGQIDVTEVVDPRILGGVVLYFGSQVIDESIKSRMNKLREVMARVDSYWMKTLLDQPSLAL